MQTSVQRIHPLVAAAAVSIILVSLLGVATVTGILPQSNSQPKMVAQAKAQAQLQPRTGALQALPGTPTTPASAQSATAGAAAINTVVDGSTRSAAGTVERPVNLRDTLAPGETLIVTPSKPPSTLSAVAVLAPVAALAPASLPERIAEPTLATPRTATMSAKAGLAAAPPAALPATGEGTDRVAGQSPRAARSRDRLAAGTPATRVTPTRLHDGADLRSSGSVANGDSASGAPILRDSRRRLPVESQVVTTVDSVPAEALPPQRIVPVYRDQRTLRAGVPLPGDGLESGVSESVSPVYPQRGSRREPEPATSNLRLNRSEQIGRSYSEPSRSDYGVQEGPVTRFGTTLGRSLGDGIDRTISAIADVLSGSRPVLPAPQRDPYGAVPGDR